jgi:hypothetical protein
VVVDSLVSISRGSLYPDPFQGDVVSYRISGWGPGSVVDWPGDVAMSWGSTVAPCDGSQWLPLPGGEHECEV